MSNQLSPSDVTDREWKISAPLLPAAKTGERHRTTDMRQVLDGIFYVDRGGIAWRSLPREYPPWQTVYGYFRAGASMAPGSASTIPCGAPSASGRSEPHRPQPPSLTRRASRRPTKEGLSAAMTLARRSRAANGTSWSIPLACCWWSRPRGGRSGPRRGEAGAAESAAPLHALAAHLGRGRLQRRAARLGAQAAASPSAAPRDRQTQRRPQRLRRAATAMGRRAHLRVARIASQAQ